ncbi:D-alanyl-D-alanine carboxypeptidase/D-alanyl-D-alanine endopeptidase [Legionella gresilensis]|uniref:D-alanyl-D-alanine carboxypeptidase/D-alanyl-D-alanine endopeptidase n=1 Tax=Legionella gresilensis TaxID=91823 RepID=UPI001041B2DD|nr:D-alanyl-D-alanine carboxypeptidase/D-alanyl-D-alanine-endopeptidase [Legionella gresilensis]
MRLIKIYKICIGLLFSNLLYAQTSLSNEIDNLIDKTLPLATVGAYIKDLKTGEIVYQRNANKMFYPASNIKLLSAAAALYKLGPNYRYKTQLGKANKDIFIIFSGSPSLTAEKLQDLLLQLPKLGINKIEGNFIIDASSFKPPFYAPGTSYDDLGWYYAAPGSAIMINENAVAYDVNSSKLNQAPEITTKAIFNPLIIINDVTTVSKAEEKEHCSLNIQRLKDNSIRLYGCIAQAEQPRRMLFSIPDPELFASDIIKQTLTKNGIELKGKIISGKAPSSVQIIAQVESEDLAKLLEHMLEESDNLYADSITKLLAVTLTGEGTYKQGAYSIKTILTENTHLDMKQVELADGIGTRYNLITPEQLVVLLNDLYHDEKFGPQFLAILPKMGRSGTLRDRMKKTSLAGKVAAKTGSMHDVSSLSGYLAAPNGKEYIFSIISNGINTNIFKAKELEEKILLAVANENDIKKEQPSND